MGIIDWMLQLTSPGKLKHTHTQDPAQKDPREQHKASIQRCIPFLVHASQCRDPMCTQPGCIKIKIVLRHFKICWLRASVGCALCKAFLLLCYSHAKSCTDEKCLVLLCARIKKKLRERHTKEQMKQNSFMHQDHKQGSTYCIADNLSSDQSACSFLLTNNNKLLPSVLADIPAALVPPTHLVPIK